MYKELAIGTHDEQIVRPIDARPIFVFIGAHQGPQIRIVSSALRPGMARPAGQLAASRHVFAMFDHT